jgi:anti-sigma28 factor (negative regulator of flagellin synthesis)
MKITNTSIETLATGGAAAAGGVSASQQAAAAKSKNDSVNVSSASALLNLAKASAADRSAKLASVASLVRNGQYSTDNASRGRRAFAVSPFVNRAAEAGTRVSRVASLLELALADLTDFRQAAPALRCSAALAEAAGELKALEQIRQELAATASSAERDSLQRNLRGLLLQLRRVEGLLASAGDFYRGWCAAGYSAASELCYSATGYDSISWSNQPGPALLAVQG